MHKGFQKTWQAYKSTVTNRVVKIEWYKSRLEKWKSRTVIDMPTIITGHSRGGALAALAFRSTMSMAIPKTDCSLNLGKTANPLVNIKLVPLVNTKSDKTCYIRSA